IPLTPTVAGDLTQTFGLVDEGVAWFSDAANGGGPADDFLKLHVVFTDMPSSNPDGGAVADMSDGGDDGTGGGGDGSGGNGSGGNGDDGNPPPTTTTHKGCSMGGAGDGDAGALWLAMIAFAIVLRTARRARPRRGAGA
ncbi:MAG TPA: hypothetical protein VGL86_24665, partial [Polyangia bacterium]